MAVYKFAYSGRVKLGEIDDALIATANNPMSNAVRFFDPGCHSELMLTMTTEEYTSTNACSGEEVEDFTRVKSRKLDLKATFDTASHANLRAFFLATTTPADSAPVPVTGRVINPATGPAVYKAGEYSYLFGMNLTSVTLQGNAVALVLNTDYEIDVKYGRIRWLANITGPVTANFSYQNPARSALLNSRTKSYVLIKDGEYVETGAAGQTGFYRVKPTLSGDFGLTNIEKSTFSVNFKCLADASKPYGGLLGQFGYMQGYSIPDII
ncbi:MAG: hypothetical protein ACRCWJ_09585 [Casimicrobium sp.]